MSYLQMGSAPVSDASKMIISFWFRDATGGDDPPPAKTFPQGFWEPGRTGDDTMVSPNTQYLVGALASFPFTGDTFKNSAFFWNSFGLPFQGIGGLIFGNLFLGPCAAWYPTPPACPDDNMRFMLTWGNPDQQYNYANWKLDTPDVIKAVYYTSGLLELAVGLGWPVPSYPPPYAPYATHVGDNGLVTVQNVKLDGSTTSGGQDAPTVPQSFIGVSKDGYLTICLQTSTTAEYKGMAFHIKTVKELWATVTYLKVLGPPYSYTEIGFPFPDGEWIAVPGYWNGYEFENEDVSQQVMGRQPEAFVLGGPSPSILGGHGPLVKGRGWHHVLFSFDIGGSVTRTDPAAPASGSAQTIVSSNCQAWLAVDDVECTGESLQHGPILPGNEVAGTPRLHGTETTEILQLFGPMVAFSRSDLKLGPNDIIPQNVWVHDYKGNARDGILRFAANSDIVGDGTDPTDLATMTALKYGSSPGDFNPFDWTGQIWPLYGHGVAPGPWKGVLMPPAPTVPDPKTDLSLPSYSASGFSIPMAGQPIGIPCSDGNVNHNTGLEMAELQIWIGKSCDSGTGSRRLFLDYPNGDKTQGGLKPVSMKTAENAFGKPDIKLHGSTAWENGKNTGSSGVDSKGNINPGGQFTPVADIEKFTPDPVLGA